MGIFSRIGRAMREVLSREELPVDPAGPPGVLKESFMEWLLKPETLEEDPRPPERGRRPLLSWFLGREQLPEDPVQAAERTGFLRMLFEPESLAFEESGEKGD